MYYNSNFNDNELMRYPGRTRNVFILYILPKFTGFGRALAPGMQIMDSGNAAPLLRGNALVSPSDINIGKAAA